MTKLGRPPKPTTPELTPVQFEAFADVARLRAGPSTALVFDVLVNGFSPSQAAHAHGMHLANGSAAVSRARATLRKIRIAAGTEMPDLKG